MSAEELNYYASWASIISLFISIFSLLYLRSIKHNIIRYRRKQRVRSLLMSALAISLPGAPESTEKLRALCRNLPVHWWSRFTSRGRITVELHKRIEAGDMEAIREVIYDWLSYTEDL